MTMIRNRTKKKISKRRVPIQLPEDPLLVRARAESHERRRRFLIALSYIVDHLTVNDIDEIMPILERAAGRVMIENTKTWFDRTDGQERKDG